MLSIETVDDGHVIFEFLRKHNTFSFPVLNNGLFPAANLQTTSEYTGYQNVWVRDNIHIAHAHYIAGDINAAVKNLTTFAAYFIKHQWRFEKIIAGDLDFNNPMNRPHVRFNGNDLSEIDQKWSHAQNDALGYFVWLFCKLANDGKIAVTEAQFKVLGLFALYFDKIQYWQDEDNGHWEETKKIEASSIGAVVAGLIQFRILIQTHRICCPNNSIDQYFLDNLINKGKAALYEILPFECVQQAKQRLFDGALLFLIYPLNVIQNETLEDQILENIRTHLQGNYGIRRYIGDSYWSADYKEKVEADQRTIDVSDDMSGRDSLLQIGEEAQWCIFDPIVSVIHGLKYKRTRDTKYLQLQIDYLNRSLSQLTKEDSSFGPFKCPELYFLENGVYVPNDATPLLWTQANLLAAFKAIE